LVKKTYITTALALNRRAHLRS